MATVMPDRWLLAAREIRATPWQDPDHNTPDARGSVHAWAGNGYVRIPVLDGQLVSGEIQGDGSGRTR